MVPLSLQAVRYLAECRANREKMKGELGMMLSLQNVMQKQVPVITTSLFHTHTFKDMLAVHFLNVNLNLGFLLFCVDNACQSADFLGRMTSFYMSRQDECRYSCTVIVNSQNCCFHISQVIF